MVSTAHVILEQHSGRSCSELHHGQSAPAFLDPEVCMGWDSATQENVEPSALSHMSLVMRTLNTIVCLYGALELIKCFVLATQSSPFQLSLIHSPLLLTAHERCLLCLQKCLKSGHTFPFCIFMLSYILFSIIMCPVNYSSSFKTHCRNHLFHGVFLTLPSSPAHSLEKCDAFCPFQSLSQYSVSLWHKPVTLYTNATLFLYLHSRF